MTTKLLKMLPKEIRIFSRDEKKQDDMRKNFKDNKIKFFIGDIRDQKSVEQAVIGVDYIFHAAALKQVPSCEFYPMEAVKTNILGIDILLNEAIKNNVKKIVCLSTDKAVYPINAMGVSKSMMEKVIIARSRISKKTKICITRYGNVIYSRGSVIPLFIKLIHANKPLTVTNINMTRFLMSMSEAIDLALFAFKNGKNGDIFVKKSPAATINTIIDSLSKIYKKKIIIKTIGVRHGEKTHETLLTKEELKQSKNYKEYFKIVSDNRDLNYEKFYTNGMKNFKNIDDYTSENTKRLNLAQTVRIIENIIKKKDFIN
jgi:UDP-N-acetylglucosamine 4,6-dehydratase/5-epimerase